MLYSQTEKARLKKDRILGTKGGKPKESKKYPEWNRSCKWIASQCVPLGVCGSVFTMRIADRVIGVGGAIMSDGYRPRYEVTSFSLKYL